MDEVEKLHFKIGLSGTYWGKKPQYSILINDATVVASTQVSVARDEVFFVEFDHDVVEGPTKLIVRFENKESTDTLKDDETREDYTIVDDMLLNIESIEIDEIDLGNLLYTAKFIGDDPARPVLDKCKHMGWNGAWTLEFASPFYIWLLENI
jgi:hypothetical protein